MEIQQTADDLLAHFDRPKTLELPDFEWDEQALPRECEFVAAPRLAVAELESEPRVEAPQSTTTRGVGWVLAWGAAIAVVAIAGSVLVELAYVLTAEHALSIAARAGALEATLPRATTESVTATVERRLSRYPTLVKQLRLTLLQNDSPVGSLLRQREGDRFAVAISAPSNSVLPDWLHWATLWHSNSLIQAEAVKTLPGRVLPAKRS